MTLKSFGVEIEGIGVYDTGLYNFCDTLYSNDGLEIPVLNVPQNMSIQVGSNVLSGSFSVSGFELYLRRTDFVISKIRSGTPTPAGTVELATSISITLSEAGLEGTTIFWRREAIDLLVETSTGVYDCTRGVLGTVNLGDSLEGDVRFYTSIPSIRGRVAWITLNRERLFPMIVSNVASVVSRGMIRIALMDLGEQFTSTPAITRPWIGEVSGIVGSNPNDTLNVRIETVPQTAANLQPLPWGVVGEPIYLKYRDSVFEAEYLVPVGRRATLYFNPVLPFNWWTPPIERSSLENEGWRGGEVEQVFISGTHLPDDAIGLIMALLTTTKAGNNGDFDYSLPINGGVSVSNFDILDIENIRNRVLHKTKGHRVVVSSKTNVMEIVKGILAGSGLTLTTKWGSGWTFREFKQSENPTTLTFLNTNVTQDDALDKITDSVTIEFSPAQRFIDDVRTFSPVDTHLNEVHSGVPQDAFVVKAPTVTKLIDVFWLGTTLSTFYNKVRPEITAEIPYDELPNIWDTVLVQDKALENQGEQLCIVEGITFYPLKQCAQVYLKIIGEQTQKINWSCLIETVTGSNQAKLKNNYFIPVGGNGIYTKDHEAIQVGFKFVVVNINGAELTGNVMTVVSIDSSGNMVYSGADLLAVDDFIRSADFTPSIDAQTEEFIYLNNGAKYTI